MCGCVDAWRCECVAVWMCGCLDAWMCGYVAVWTCGHVDVSICVCVDGVICGGYGGTCACICMRYDKICYATLCYAMLCSTMLCYAMPCYAMPCYTMCRCYAMRVNMPLFSTTPLPYCIGLLTHGLLNAWFAHASRKLTAYHRIAHGTALSRSVAADLLQLIPRRAL